MQRQYLELRADRNLTESPIELTEDQRSELQDNLRLHYEKRYAHRVEAKQRHNLKRIRGNLRNLLVAEGDWVIDVGCGLGTTGLYLSARGALPFGVDLAFEAARGGSASGGYLATSQANAEMLPFADSSFDAATFMGTLEHFVSPRRALREATRVLKPGAQACFIVPNSEFFLFSHLGGTDQILEVPRSYGGWSQLFMEQGWRIESVYRDSGPGICDWGNPIRGLVRGLVLLLSSLLPVRYTYQFVFICRSLSMQVEQVALDPHTSGEH